MKILLLISSTGLYGAEKVVLNLAQGLKDIGIKPVVANLVDNDLKNTGIIVEARLRTIEAKEIYCNKGMDFKGIRALKDYILTNNFDLIHSHGYKSNLYVLLTRSAKKIKLVATCHNWTSNNLKMKTYELVDKLILKGFDRVVAVSSQVMQKLEKSRIPKQKLSLIYNGIPISQTDIASGILRNEYNLTNNTVCIGTIGRLSKEKGQRYLIKAFHELLKRNYDLALFIIGDGPLKMGLIKEAEAMGIINKVFFTGYRVDINNILSSLDIFVLPSLKEGTPIVLLEAMASRIPVIATKVGAIPLIIDDNESGLLVEAGSVDGLKGAIEELLRDKDKANYLVQNAYEKVAKEFSLNKMVEEYKRIYESI